MKKIQISWSIVFISLIITSISSILFAKDCPLPKDPIVIHSIHPQSQNLIDKAILDNAPVIYLAREDYFPMTMEYYINHPDTQVLYDHKEKKVVIPKGEITMEALTNIDYSKYPNSGVHIFLSGSKCVDQGDHEDTIYKISHDTSSAPRVLESRHSKSANTNLLFKSRESNEKIKTPYYAIFSQTASGHDYIQYLFLYGYNGDYTVAGISTGSSHKMDLEHLVLEFEGGSIHKGKPKLTRIGFPTHGSGEAKWLDADNKDLTFETIDNKNHIVGYSAYHGHGMYPEIGTYVRIVGFGNDVTKNHRCWFPTAIIRLELPESNAFNPQTMGWVKFQGNLGPDGVGGIQQKPWVGKAHLEDAGMGYKEMYCKPSDSTCVFTKGFHASIPKSRKVTYENNTTFSPNNLPASEIKVPKGTTFTFYKTNRDIPSQRQTIKITKKLHIEVEGKAIVGEMKDKYNIQFTHTGKVYLTFSDDTETKASTTNVVKVAVSVE